MRRIRIEHVTEYRFPQATRLMEHRMRLRPREDHGVRIESSTLSISPPPALRWQRDALDNSVEIAVFNTPTERLHIASAVIVEHYDETPLDFIVDDPGVTLPFSYAAEDARLLAPFLPLSCPDDGVLRSWMRSVGVTTVPTETFFLLDRVNRAIRTGFRYQAREEQGVQTPSETITRGVGSCRDFAMLFVEACRVLGLASRFVSGYQLSPAATGPASPGATHAWAEVYIPGPGWKGFDPTSGTLAGADHIAVAVAREGQWVPPVAGSYVTASTLTPTLHVSVRVALL